MSNIHDKRIKTIGLNIVNFYLLIFKSVVIIPLYHKKKNCISNTITTVSWYWKNYKLTHSHGNWCTASQQCQTFQGCTPWLPPCWLQCSSGESPQQSYAALLYQMDLNSSSWNKSSFKSCLPIDTYLTKPICNVFHLIRCCWRSVLAKICSRSTEANVSMKQDLNFQHYLLKGLVIG